MAAQDFGGSRPLKRFTRTCLFCGGEARIMAPEGSDDLDVDAEFSSAGREFGSYDEHEGVGCYRCSTRRWRAENAAATPVDAAEENTDG